MVWNLVTHTKACSRYFTLPEAHTHRMNNDSLSPLAVTIGPLGGDQAEQLFHQSTLALQALYPDESNHFVDPQELTSPPSFLLGAWVPSPSDEAWLVGCVGLLRDATRPNVAEVKRLFVVDAQRNRGVATALMDALENRARDQGVSLLRLETGAYQPESLALYERRGYTRIPPFDHYSDDPLSVFMAKDLSATLI
jgi:putative acetyltransferase